MGIFDFVTRKKKEEELGGDFASSQLSEQELKPAFPDEPLQSRPSFDVQQPAFLQGNSQSSGDMQLLLTKVELINQKLEVIDRRLQTIEKIAKDSQ